MGTDRYRDAALRNQLEPHPDSLLLARELELHAPSLLNLAIADPCLLEEIRTRPLDRAHDVAVLKSEFAPIAALEEAALFPALRRARHRGMIRIALREILCFADIDQTAAELASLASVAIDAALGSCRRSLENRMGEVLGEKRSCTLCCARDG